MILQAEKFRAKAQRPEQSRSHTQYCRYLYYLGRIKAIQLEYTDARDYLQQAARKVWHHPCCEILLVKMELVPHCAGVISNCIQLACLLTHCNEVGTVLCQGSESALCEQSICSPLVYKPIWHVSVVCPLCLAVARQH